MAKREKRVVILADTQTHMMPALAREMARRNHNLVLGDAKDGLADELIKLGAKVEVVPDTTDQTKQDTIQKLVDRAKNAFGGFDSACIRTGTHGTGTILEATFEDCQIQYEGNFRSVFYALKALLPPLVEQKSGQVVINTSTAGLRPQTFVSLYSAFRAGANALVRCAGLTVAPAGVAVNAPGQVPGVVPEQERTQVLLVDLGDGADELRMSRGHRATLPLNLLAIAVTCSWSVPQQPPMTLRS